MGFDTYINLHNQYEFKQYCSYQSIKIFDLALKKDLYPSRKHLIWTLGVNTLTFPLYLAHKVTHLALYLFTLICLKEEQRRESFTVTHLPDFLCLIALQLLLPLTCVAIRIYATIAGLVVPRSALEGWRLAEVGERLSYQLWNTHAQDWIKEEEELKAYEEITPTYACFYLGFDRCFQLMHEGKNPLNREEVILQELTKLLKELLSKNRECFQHLLHYDCAIKGQKMAKHWSNYFLSFPIKEILQDFKEKFNNEDFAKQEDFDEWLIDQIKTLSLKQLEELQLHLSTNLQFALLEDDLNLNQREIEKQFILLKDLFSQHLRFGRAHFPQAYNNFNIYARV